MSDFHTYFVGEAEAGWSVWAHNSCTPEQRRSLDAEMEYLRDRGLIGAGWMYDLAQLDVVMTHLASRALEHGDGNWQAAEAHYRGHLEAVKWHLDGAGGTRWVSPYNVEWQPAAWVDGYGEGRAPAWALESDTAGNPVLSRHPNDGLPWAQPHTARLDAGITRPSGQRPSTLEVLLPGEDPVLLGYDISYSTEPTYERGRGLVHPKSLVEEMYLAAFHAEVIRDIRAFRGYDPHSGRQRYLDVYQFHSFMERGGAYAPNMVFANEVGKALYIDIPATGSRLTHAVGWATRIDDVMLAAMRAR